MSKQITAWFTTKTGKHIPIFEGESKQDAIKRALKSDKTVAKQPKTEKQPKEDAVDKKTVDTDKKSDAEHKSDLDTDNQKKESSKIWKV